MAELEKQGVRLTDLERRRQRARSVAIGITLGVLALLFYVMTFAKFSEMLR